MSRLGNLEAGSRHDLLVGLSPDAPDEADFRDDGEGAFGYVHSYESSSRYDGPGLRMVLFVSGCLLRCSYCHNPDTWHLKDGTYVSAEHVINRLGTFAPALRSLDGGLTISGGEPMVQLGFTRRILAAARQMGLHTAIETSGFLGDRADERYLGASISCCWTSKAGIRKPIAPRPAGIWRRRCASPSAWPQSASRYGCASRWCRDSPMIPPTSIRSPGSSPR